MAFTTQSNQSQLTKDQVIDIAIRKAEQLGYSTFYLKVRGNLYYDPDELPETMNVTEDEIQVFPYTKAGNR